MSDSGGKSLRLDLSELVAIRPVETHFGEMHFGPEAGRRSHDVKTPKAPEWLAARERFREQWEALCELGEREGFLESGPDGDMWVTTADADVTRVYDETEDEWRERVAALDAKTNVLTAEDLPPGSFFLSTRHPKIVVPPVVLPSTLGMVNKETGAPIRFGEGQ